MANYDIADKLKEYTSDPWLLGMVEEIVLMKHIDMSQAPRLIEVYGELDERSDPYDRLALAKRVASGSMDLAEAKVIADARRS